jgi:hypothetical protein
VEDQADMQLGRRSRPSSAIELRVDRAERPCSLESYVRAHNQTVFYAFVPAGHQLSVSVPGTLGSSLALYWRAVSAPAPQQGLYDGRCAAGPRLQLRWRAADAGVPAALFIVIDNDSSLVAPYVLQACMRPVRTGSPPRRQPGGAWRDQPMTLRELVRRVLLLQSLVGEMQRMRAANLSPPSMRRSGEEAGTAAPRPSHRLLEARAHSHAGGGAWNEISDGWQAMTAEAERCREQVRLWRDPDFQPGASPGFRDGSVDPIRPWTHPTSRSSSPRSPWFGRSGSTIDPTPRGEATPCPASSEHRHRQATAASPLGNRAAVAAGLLGNLACVSPVRWLPLRVIIGGPHIWPDGRRSYLFSYDKNAAEVSRRGGVP